MQRDLENLRKRLKSNPIYALSLGSRELFHSNFLGWMFENYPHTIATVYDGALPKDFTVKREESNFDLKIDFTENDVHHAVIIEVKVKDAPRLDQLVRYDQKLKKLSDDGVVVHKFLLSLVPAWENLRSNGNWHYLSFFDLGEKIFEVATATNVSDEHRIIIQSYAQLCRDLGTLVTKVTEVKKQAPEELFFKVAKKNSHDELESVVEDIGFSDTLGKYNASALCEEIKRCAAKVNFGDINPSFQYGFDRKTPHVGASFAIELQDAAQSKLDLGIHIQGRQYRRMLSFDRFSVPSIKEGKNTEGLRSFIEETDGWNWMFGSKYVNKFLQKTACQGGFFKDKAEIPSKQQNGKLLCSYAPRYIYQYTNIGEAPGVPIDKVVEAIIADLRYAAQLLNDSNYLARFEKYSPISQ